jgi:hypothetical protein
MIDRALETAEKIARRAIPDIGELPLYIVHKPDSILTRAMLADCDGRYVHGGDVAARPVLEAAGLWRGPGVVIACDLAGIVRDYPADEFAIERATTGLVCHELCHWLLDELPPADAADGPSIHAAVLGEAEERSTAEPTHWPTSLYSHPAGFIRAAVHCWYRANSPRGCDYFLPAYHLSFASSYRTLQSMSPPRAYCAVLSSEIQCRQHEPLRAILATPAPEAFQALFRADSDRVFAAAFAAAREEKKSHALALHP